MSERDPSLYIVDILIAIDKIHRYTENVFSANELLHDEIVWDAVIRELQVIGDATNSLLQLNLIKPDYRRIVDFRNTIVHGYFGIDHNIVWYVVGFKLNEYITELFEVAQKETIDLTEAIAAAKIDHSFNKNVLGFLDSLIKRMV